MKPEMSFKNLQDVPMQVTVELGRTTLLIKEVLSLGEGSVVELDKLAGEPVDLLVNGKKFALGEVVVIDENFGVRITEILDIPFSDKEQKDVKVEEKDPDDNTDITPATLKDEDEDEDDPYSIKLGDKKE